MQNDHGSILEKGSSRHRGNPRRVRCSSSGDVGIRISRARHDAAAAGHDRWDIPGPRRATGRRGRCNPREGGTAGHEKRRAATCGHRLANGSSRQRSLGQESPPFDTSTSGHPGRTRGDSHTRYLNRRAWAVKGAPSRPATTSPARAPRDSRSPGQGTRRLPWTRSTSPGRFRRGRRHHPGGGPRMGTAPCFAHGQGAVFPRQVMTCLRSTRPPPMVPIDPRPIGRRMLSVAHIESTTLARGACRGGRHGEADGG